MEKPFDSIESNDHIREWWNKQRKDIEEQERNDEAFLKIPIKVALWTSVLIFSFVMGGFFFHYATNCVKDACVQYHHETSKQGASI